MVDALVSVDVCLDILVVQVFLVVTHHVLEPVSVGLLQDLLLESHCLLFLLLGGELEGEVVSSELGLVGLFELLAIKQVLLFLEVLLTFVLGDLVLEGSAGSFALLVEAGFFALVFEVLELFGLL